MSNPSATYPLIYHHKPLLTPARNPLEAPTRALHDAILAEWEALGKNKPKPELLPLTGYAALALDVVVPHHAEVLNELLEYGETDLLFYRAEWGSTPPNPHGSAASRLLGEKADVFTLHAQQRREWQPWINWAQTQFDTRYQVAEGIVPVAQPSTNSNKHRTALEALSVWQLACLAAVVKPTTSLILGLAFVGGEMGADELFRLSRLEEAYNTARWGEDEEAAERANNLRRDLQAAERWKNLLSAD